MQSNYLDTEVFRQAIHEQETHNLFADTLASPKNVFRCFDGDKGRSASQSW